MRETEVLLEALLGSGPRERQQPMAHVLAAQQDQVIASAAAAGHCRRSLLPAIAVDRRLSLLPPPV